MRSMASNTWLCRPKATSSASRCRINDRPWDVQLLDASPEVRLHSFGHGVGDRQAAQVGAVLAEGADEMCGGEARCLKRLLGTHAEFHVVKDDLDGCLILLVAACYRDRHHGMVVMKKQ